MKKLNTTLTAIAIVTTMIATSCKKKEVAQAAEVVDSDTNGASDNYMAENASDDVSNIGGQVSENPNSSYRATILVLSCAAVTYDTANTNRKIAVEFNGICSDGHTRSGTLNFDFSGSTNGAKRYRHPGYKMVVTSTNYMVDGLAITINKTVTNTTDAGFDPSVTNLTWSETDNTTIVKSTGTISWQSSKTKTLLNTNDNTVYHGANTPISWDKAIRGITGTASGTTSGGDTFTATSTSQLVRDFNCSPGSNSGHHPFIKGTLDFTPGSKATRHIDYGYPNNGACDDSVKITIKTRSFALKL